VRRPLDNLKLSPTYNHSHEHGRLCLHSTTKGGSQLRRIVVVATALAVLVAAASAYAATGGFNTYSAKLSFAPNKAGSAKAPSALSFTQQYTAGGTNGNRTAPLTDIKTKIYGIVPNSKPFPTCSAAKIGAAKSDAGCPKGALVATGSITALIGPANSPSAQGLPCDPLLHAWNGGGNKVVFFFVDQPPLHTCAGGAIMTGGVPPFVGTTKVVGKTLVMDTPIPPAVSFPLPGIEGSLTGETLKWLKLTKKVNGKTVAFNQSVACNKGKRPYSVTFTAVMNGQSQSGSASGTQKCS